MPEMTEEQFTAEAAAFLDTHGSRKAEQKAFVWGEGPDNAAMFEEVDREKEQLDLASAKEWRAKKFDAGFGWISGPAELGGGGHPRRFERTWANLESQYDVPDGGFFGIGLGMVAPTILAHGNPEVVADL